MMKPKLTHNPNKTYAYDGIQICFENGAPLSADQYNFLYRHEKSLSGSLDPLKKYYLKPYYQKKEASFLFHNDELNQENVKHLKTRLEALVVEKKHPLRFQLPAKQFLAFRAATIHELILYHGNQFLTGAPFHPGGIPYTLFFQWGNLFGVAKYQILPDEKELMGNVLIEVEDKGERLLEQYVHAYQQQHISTPSLKHPIPEPVQKPTPLLKTQPKLEPIFHSPFTIPTLTLSRFTSKEESKKK